MFETLDEEAITKLKNAAIAVVESAFNACDKSKYDEAGIAKLEDALKSGKDAINAATTEAAIKDARDKAISQRKGRAGSRKSITTGSIKLPKTPARQIGTVGKSA